MEQNRYVLSIYFCIRPFQLPDWLYGIQQELIDETPITNYYPSTFTPLMMAQDRTESTWVTINQPVPAGHYEIDSATGKDIYKNM